MIDHSWDPPSPHLLRGGGGRVQDLPKNESPGGVLKILLEREDKPEKGGLQGLNQQSTNRNLLIKFVFLQITLSSFSEICESKLSFCWNFCLQGNHKVSVYTSSSTNHLYLTPKSVKLYTIFLHLDSILAPNP